MALDFIDRLLESPSSRLLLPDLKSTSEFALGKTIGRTLGIGTGVLAGILLAIASSF